MASERLTNATAARLLAEALVRNRVERVFYVPGESYLALLDALHDTDIAVTVCRHEGGAAMAAEAWGKLTGRPDIAMVTRGPGATVACTEDFAAAFERCVESGKPSIIDLAFDPEAITPSATLSEIRGSRA